MFDFWTQQNPNPTRTGVDHANLAGTMIGDLGGFANSAATVAGATGDSVSRLTGPMANLLGGLGVSPGALGQAGSGGAAFGNFMLGASEIASGQVAGGLGDLGAGVMNTVGFLNPEMAASCPGLGVAAGAMQALGHGYEAYTHLDEIDGGYQNNQFWTETGNATFGALSAAAALDPTGVSSLYVGGTQLALDGIGALAGMIGGEDYRFTAGSAIGAAEHAVFDTGQAIGEGAMAAWDTVSSW